MSPGSDNTMDLHLPPSPSCWQSEGVSPHRHVITFHPNKENHPQALLRSVLSCLQDKFWVFWSNEGRWAVTSLVSAFAFRGPESTRSAGTSLGSSSSLLCWDHTGSTRPMEQTMAFFPWAAWVDVGLTHHGEPKTLPPPTSKAEMPPERACPHPPAQVMIHPRQPQRSRRPSQAGGGGE